MKNLQNAEKENHEPRKEKHICSNVLRSYKFFIFRFPSILDKYLFQEFFGPFVLAIGGFVIIGIVDILFTLVDLFVNSGVSFFIILRLLLYKIPAIMVLFFPMAVLFAVMLLLIRMAKDNEITVLRSSGISLIRILVPLLILAVLASYLSFFTNEKIVPWANNVSDNLIRISIQKTPPPDIVENIFFKDSGDRYFYINRVNSKASIMENVLIYELTRDYPRIISAKQAYWDSKTWYLKNGLVQDLDENGYLTYSAKFDVMMIRVDRDLQSFYSEQKTTREMDSKELREQINVLEKGGISTRNLKVEFFLKRSIPAACFIFALIGIAFCFLFVRSGKDWWGVILAVCISVLAVGFYFFIVAVCRSLGRSGGLDPILAAWLPNLIYGILGFILILYEIYRR